MKPAARLWAEMLDGWTIPEDILYQAPEAPWGFVPEQFVAPDGADDTPARRLALEAVPERGTVLDVGCGGGAASLALVPPAGKLVGLDDSPAMLEHFAAACEERGVAHSEVHGLWPGVARSVPAADVVVCQHVAYNARDLVAFVVGLSGGARSRVVLTMAAEHPSIRLAPLWRHFWKLKRPTGPRAEDALEVLDEAGIVPVIERWTGERAHLTSFEDEVRMVRRRLCLSADRDDEVAAALKDLPSAPHETVTFAWPGDG